MGLIKYIKTRKQILTSGWTRILDKNNERFGVNNNIIFFSSPPVDAYYRKQLEFQITIEKWITIDHLEPNWEEKHDNAILAGLYCTKRIIIYVQ